jgi:hypothetical protein
MAKITTSANAPSEVVTYGFASGDFKLAAGEVYETDDKALLASARIHPWLKVEYEKSELISGQVRDTLANHPDKDVMTSEHKDSNVPFDAEEIRKVEEAKYGVDDMGLAVDANLKQDTPKTVGRGDDKTAVTLAADEDREPADSDESDGESATNEGMPEGKQPAERDVAEPGPRNVTDKTKG